MTTPAAVPILELPRKPSFMVVDGKTYFVDAMELAPNDMLKQIEGYYKDNLEVLKAKVASHIAEETRLDLEAQVNRIERHLASGIVAIPDGLRAQYTILMLANNKVHESRIMLFRPTRLSVTVQRITEWVQWVETGISRKDAERYTKFMDWAKPLSIHLRSIGRDISGMKVDIKIEQDIFVGALVASYVAEENLIRVMPDNIHPHVHGGGKLCCGGTPARDFWDHPDWKNNFNSINPHSFANSSTECARNHQLLLKNQYFVEGRLREEATAWRVS